MYKWDERGERGMRKGWLGFGERERDFFFWVCLLVLVALTV